MSHGRAAGYLVIWTATAARRLVARGRRSRPYREGRVLNHRAGLPRGDRGLALLVAHRDGTITDLRAALRNARRPAPATAVGPPAESGSALFSLPDAALGSFSVVAVAVRPRPGATALTWLFVYGQHVDPGQHYGLLDGICGGQYVSATDLADGTADRSGDLTIAAHDLGVGSQAPDYWVMLYRWDDGAPLGGVRGPLIGGGARIFRAAPPC